MRSEGKGIELEEVKAGRVNVWVCREGKGEENGERKGEEKGEGKEEENEGKGR